MIPFFLPIAENAPTAPTTATAQFTVLEVILKNQYRTSPKPAPIRNGEIADSPLKAALPNIPLSDFIAFAKGFFFATSERTRVLTTAANTAFPKMLPTAPKNPPNIPPLE